MPLEPPKSSTSYDDLRRQNREEYEKKMANPYYKPLSQDEVPSISRSRQPSQSQPDFSEGTKNKYGDIFAK